MRLANHTKRSIDEIKEAWAEFYAEINSPWNLMLFISAMLFLAVLMFLPWLGGEHFQ